MEQRILIAKNTPQPASLDLNNLKIKNLECLPPLPLVASVSLSNNKVKTLNGYQKIPAGIKSLCLYNNSIKEFSSGVPQHFSKLTRLILSYNQLKEFPSSIIGNCPNITTLDLSGNKIKSLATNFPHLTTLKSLRLADNKLERITDIGKLTNLRELILRNNRVAILPKDIGNCRHLVDLHLQNNQLGILPQELSTLNFDKPGTRLELDGNPLDREIKLRWQDVLIKPRQYTLIKWMKTPEYTQWIHDKTQKALFMAKMLQQ